MFVIPLRCMLVCKCAWACISVCIGVDRNSFFEFLVVDQLCTCMLKFCVYVYVYAYACLYVRICTFASAYEFVFSNSEAVQCEYE